MEHLDLDEALPRLHSNDSTLTNLCLFCNGIVVGGARAVAKALKKNSTLMNLYFYGNGIGVEGA